MKSGNNIYNLETDMPIGLGDKLYNVIKDSNLTDGVYTVVGPGISNNFDGFKYNKIIDFLKDQVDIEVDDFADYVSDNHLYGLAVFCIDGTLLNCYKIKRTVLDKSFKIESGMLTLINSIVSKVVDKSGKDYDTVYKIVRDCLLVDKYEKYVRLGWSLDELIDFLADGIKSGRL
jgi:hypothetical protein